MMDLMLYMLVGLCVVIALSVLLLLARVVLDEWGTSPRALSRDEFNKVFRAGQK